MSIPWNIRMEIRTKTVHLQTLNHSIIYLVVFDSQCIKCIDIFVYLIAFFSSHVIVLPSERIDFEEVVLHFVLESAVTHNLSQVLKRSYPSKYITFIFAIHHCGQKTSKSSIHGTLIANVPMSVKESLDRTYLTYVCIHSLLTHAETLINWTCSSSMEPNEHSNGEINAFVICEFIFERKLFSDSNESTIQV